MKLGRIAAGVLVISMVALVLVGCGGGDEGGNGNGSGEATPTVPVPSAPETMTAEPGAPADLGPWTLTVTNVRRAGTFGKHVADDGELVLVEVSLANNSENPLMTLPQDYSLTDGESYTSALEGDDDYPLSVGVQPGETGQARAVFFVPDYIASRPLTFAFQNAASGETVRLEVPLP